MPGTRMQEAGVRSAARGPAMLAGDRRPGLVGLLGATAIVLAGTVLLGGCASTGIAGPAPATEVVLVVQPDDAGRRRVIPRGRVASDQEQLAVDALCEWIEGELAGDHGAAMVRSIDLSFSTSGTAALLLGRRANRAILWPDWRQLDDAIVLSSEEAPHRRFDAAFVGDRWIDLKGPTWRELVSIDDIASRVEMPEWIETISIADDGAVLVLTGEGTLREGTVDARRGLELGHPFLVGPGTDAPGGTVGAEGGARDAHDPDDPAVAGDAVGPADRFGADRLYDPPRVAFRIRALHAPPRARWIALGFDAHWEIRDRATMAMIQQGPGEIAGPSLCWEHGFVALERTRRALEDRVEVWVRPSTVAAGPTDYRITRFAIPAEQTYRSISPSGNHVMATIGSSVTLNEVEGIRRTAGGRESRGLGRVTWSPYPVRGEAEPPSLLGWLVVPEATSPDRDGG